jgi:hypothetical protein
MAKPVVVIQFQRWKMLACDQNKKSGGSFGLCMFQVVLIKCYFNVTFVAKCDYG